MADGQLAGTMTTPGGATLDYTTHPATGAEGVYDVGIAPNGAFTATRVEQAADGFTGTLGTYDDPRGLLAGAAEVSYEGQTFLLTTDMPADAAGSEEVVEESRLLLVADDGEVIGYGASKRTTNTTSASDDRDSTDFHIWLPG